MQGKQLKNVVTFLLLGLIFVPVKQVAATDLSAKWKNGLRWESEDKSVQLKAGGRIYNDWTFFVSEDDSLVAAVGDLEDGSEFRASRLYMAGKIHNKLEFKAEYDFAGGDADFKDVYIGLLDVPVVGNIRAGHFKEPVSLENLTSSKYITFMERSLTTVFAPSRNNGIMIHDTFGDKIGTYAVGIFRDVDDYGDGTDPEDSSYSYTGRVTAAPVYEDGGAQVVHVGASISIRNPNEDMIRYRARPEIHNGPRFVDTGDLSADQVTVVGGELALVQGPFSLQGEYAQAFVDSAVGSADPDFPSFYVAASFFLTGESRAYDQKKGAFGRVTPNSDYIAAEPGSGAVELAARWSYLDLDDSAIMGGELQDVTAGINWYLHPNARIMLNYVFADEDTAGEAHILQNRFQVDF